MRNAMLSAALVLLVHGTGPMQPATRWGSVARQLPPRRRLGDGSCAAAQAVIEKLTPIILSDFNVSAISVGLICNHSVALSKGFGVANRAKGIAATDRTLYQVASNSKLFTATASLLMAEEGKLDLDQPVRAANPAFVFADEYGAESLTPRDLLSHRTGLPRHDRVTFQSASRVDGGRFLLSRRLASLASLASWTSDGGHFRIGGHDGARGQPAPRQASPVPAR